MKQKDRNIINVCVNSTWLSLSLLLAEIKEAGVGFNQKKKTHKKPITHNSLQCLCSVMHQWQYNKSACLWEPGTAQLGKEHSATCIIMHHLETLLAGSAEGRCSDFPPFVTASSRHHCLVECSWFLAIFPISLPPFITSPPINLLTLAEGVEYTASFPAVINTYMEIRQPTKGGHEQ